MTVKPFQPTEEHPDLFEQTGDDEYSCVVCGTAGQVESVAFESFGGTTEGWEKCLACGTSEGWCDLSAVI